jgi:hypothetical protein
MGTLRQAARKPANQEVHNCLVMNLAYQFCKQVHVVHDKFTVEKILNTNVGSAENSLLEKKRKWGMWSRAGVDARARIQFGAANVITWADVDLARGVELRFARMCSLIIPGFQTKTSRDEAVNSLTDAETATLGQEFDANTGPKVMP